MYDMSQLVKKTKKGNRSAHILCTYYYYYYYF